MSCLNRRKYFSAAMVLAASFFASALYCSSAAGSEKSRDPYFRSPEEVQVPGAVRARMDGLYYEFMPLMGSSCLAPRTPAEVEKGLAGLIEAFPEETDLYLERAGARRSMGDAAGALADIQTAVQKAKDKKRALRALADFYGDGLERKKEIEALDSLLAELEKGPTQNKAAIKSLIGEIISRASAGLVAIDEKAYRRRFVDLFPDDIEAALTYLKEVAKSSDEREALAETANFMGRFPERPEPFLAIMADIHYAGGHKDKAIEVYLDGLTPESRPSVFYSFFESLQKRDDLEAFANEIKNPAGKHSEKDKAIVFHLMLFDGDWEEASSFLERWLKDTPETKKEKLRTFARYFTLCQRHERAAQLRYGGLAEAGPKEREEWIGELYSSLLSSRSGAMAAPGSMAGPFSIRLLDPSPGITGGLLSLLLNGREMGETFSDISRMEERHANLALALNLLAKYREDFPDGRLAPEMEMAAIGRYWDLGYWNAAAAAADAFLRDHPENELAAAVLEKRCASLINLGRFEEADAGYGELLSRVGGDEDKYLAVLSEYARRLRSKERVPQMVALYWREVEAHPENRRLYDQFLQDISYLSLDEDKARLYRMAVKKIPGRGWYDRLSRYYLRSSMFAEYEETLGSAVESLPEDEIGPFLDGAVGEMKNSKWTAVKAALFLEAHRKYPRNPEYMKRYIQLAQKIEKWEKNSNSLPSPSSVEFARQNLMDDPQTDGFIGRSLLEGMMARDDLRSELARLEDGWSVNPAETYFLAIAHDHLGQYEKSLSHWRRLAEIYPGTAQFQETLSERLLGLSRSRPKEYPSSSSEAVEVMSRAAKMYPASSRFPTAIGEALAERGRFGEALAWWDKPIEAEPGRPGPYLRAAEIAWDYYQYDAAIERLRLARERLKDPALFALEIGAVLEDKGQADQAIAEYVNALCQKDGRSQYKILSRLDALAGREGLESLIDSRFQAAILHAPSNPGPVWSYYDYLNLRERSGDGGKLLLDAAERISDVKFLHEARMALEISGLKEAELAVIRKLVQAKDPSPDDVIRLVRYFRLNGGEEIGAAADSAAAVIASIPAAKARLHYYRELVEELILAGRLERAAEALRRVLPDARGDDKKSAVLEFARVLSDLDNYAEAANALDSLLEERGWDEDVFRALVSVHVARKDHISIIELNGKQKKAIASKIKGVMERRREYASLHLVTASALAELRRAGEALDYYMEWLNQDPTDPDKLRTVFVYAKQRGLEKKVIERYEKEARTANKDYRWSLSAGRLEAWDHDLKEAAKSYNRAAWNEPGKAVLYEEAAKVRVALHEYEEAAKLLESLYAIEKESDQLGRAARSWALAGREDKALEIVAASVKRGGGRSRYFKAALALEAAGLPEEGLTYLETGLEEALQKIERNSISRGELDDLVRIYAKAGKTEEAMDLIFGAWSRALEKSSNPSNKYVKWRIDQNLRAIRTAALETIPLELLQRGKAQDLASAESRINAAMKGSPYPAADLDAFAKNCGFTDQAAELVDEESKRDSNHLLVMADFWAGRLAWKKVVALDAQPSRRRANAFLWMDQPDKALAELTSLYMVHSGGYEPLLYLAAERNAEQTLKLCLDDGSNVAEEADYLVELGRPDLAIRTIRSSKDPVWSAFKEMLVKDHFSEKDPELAARAAAALRNWSVSARLDSPFNAALEARGHEYSVMAMEYARYLKLLGRGPEARDFYYAAAEESPTSYEAFRYQGILALEMGDLDLARDGFAKALEIEPPDLSSRNGLALAILKSGNKKDALKNLELLAKDSSTWDRAEYKYYAMLSRGMEKEAVEFIVRWAKAAYADYRDSGMLGVRELALLAEKKPSLARAPLTDLVQYLIASYPDDVELASSAVFEELLRGKDADPAYDALVLAYGKDRNAEGDLHLWEDRRIDHWLDTGRYEEALEELNRREIPLSPGEVPPENVKRRARALIGKGETGEALVSLESFLSLDPYSLDALKLAREVALEEGLAEKADEYQDKLFKLQLVDPDAGLEVYEGYASFLVRSGEMDAAAAVAEQAVSDKPGSLAALIKAAAIFEEMKDYQKAIGQRRLAEDLEPQDAGNLAALGADLIRIGKENEALLVFHDALVSSSISRNQKIEMLRVARDVLMEGNEEAAKTFFDHFSERAGKGSDFDDLICLAAAVSARAGGDGEYAARTASALVGPGFPSSSSFLGQTLLEAGRAKEAAGILTASLYRFPGDDDARALLGLCHLRQGEPAKAVSLIFGQSGYFLPGEFEDEYWARDRARQVLGGGLELEFKIELVRGLADGLLKLESHDAALAALGTLLDYLSEGGEYEGPSRAHEETVSAGALDKELSESIGKQLATIEKARREKEKESGQRPRVLERLDNAEAWSDLPPDLEFPGKYYWSMADEAAAGKEGQK